MKKILTTAVILSLAALISAVSYHSAFEQISDNVIRLHIIPNSNSEQDIAMKFSVRDEILSVMQKELGSNTDRSEILNSAEKIERLANRYLAENDIPYPAVAEIDNTNIPRKSYNGITMPAGNYTAIRVVLGDGGGDNWWCVAYPPLCFTEEVFGKLSASGAKQLKENIGKRGYSIISDEIDCELKIIEISEKIIDFIKNR